MAYQESENESKKRKCEENLALAEDGKTRSLICELCRNFYQAGWVTGTGGSISIRHCDGRYIFMTPSGVPKERIKPEDLFLVDEHANVITYPQHLPGENPKLSDCAPLFLHAFVKRNAGAVIHSHGIVSNLVTALCEGKNEFRISHQEMIKGITGHGYHDELVIPIIENTAFEHELADSLGEAIDRYPKSVAVLVRRHGIYIWGKSWQEAKRHAECIHYLFEIALKMHSQLGKDFCSPPILYGDTWNSNTSTGIKKVILDIEGTTTPLSFVRDVLFPYAAARTRKYLEETWMRDSTRDIVFQLLKQRKIDEADASLQPPKLDTHLLHLIMQDGVPADEHYNSFPRWIDAIDSYVQWCITKDRKTPSLKNLQSVIWEAGYTSGEIVGQVFDDVPEELASLDKMGVKLYIYSSGSRHAQNLLFKYSNHGDLRPLLSGFFDISSGPKGESQSYRNIGLSVGLDVMSDGLFVTDILDEAIAARAAGLQVLLSSRPGNNSIVGSHEFKVITSFKNLLQA